MTEIEFLFLKPGDVVRNLLSGNAYTVVKVDAHESTVTLRRDIRAMHPPEWVKIDAGLYDKSRMDSEKP